VPADLRAALIGFGLGGSVFHAPLIAATPGIALTTVVTGNPGRADEARRAHPGVRVESRPDSIWERPDEHDLAVIATPNDTHVELATRALGAGIATVIDKPMAPSSEAARDLIDLAERRGVPLTVFHNRRWDSDQLTLRRVLREGRLGEVRRYESRIERWHPELREGAWVEAIPAAEGGGVLLDLGTHLVDQALALFGPVVHTYGEVEARRGGPAEDDAFLALEHSSGVRSHLWVSAVAPAPGPRLRVLGSRAAFVVQAPDGQEDTIRAGILPAATDEWGAEPEERWGRLVSGDGSEAVRPENGAWPRFYEQLVAALREGADLPVDPKDAVAALDVLERARAT
jgi:scyllo-inositol 2-dehydrogenase (NADP+)